MAADRKVKTAARKAQLAKMGDAEKKIFLQKEKAEKFKEQAERRVGRALASIAAVQVLSNKRRYAYEDTHAEKIKTALEASVANVVRSFQTGTVGGGFKL